MLWGVLMTSAKKISITNAVLWTINIMVGGGILSGPGAMAAIAGNWSFLGWLIVAMLYLPIVLSITRMAEVFPAQGGFASYCKQGLGNFGGFLGGWIYFLGYAAAAATLISFYQTYLQISCPSCSLFSNLPLFAALVLVCLALLNNLRIDILASLQGYLTLVKLLPVFLAIGLLPFFIKTTLTFPVCELKMLPWSLTTAMFGFMGFEAAASLTSDINGGAPQARKAILIGFFLVTAIYVIFHYSLINIMGAQGLATYMAAGYPLFVVKKFSFFGKILIPLIALTTIITYFNSSNGMIGLDSSILHGIAREGQIRLAGILDYRNLYGRPYIAVAATAFFVYGLCVLAPNTLILAAVTNFGVTLTFLLANLSLWLADDQATAINKFVNLLALGLLLVLLGYHFSVLGDTLLLRLQNLSLLLFAIAFGAILYKPASA